MVQAGLNILVKLVDNGVIKILEFNFFLFIFVFEF